MAKTFAAFPQVLGSFAYIQDQNVHGPLTAEMSTRAECIEKLDGTKNIVHRSNLFVD
ncbi:hypothetical protein [Rhizobium leguminosarum]|jgi:hypothetical protein|uniref:hypothetical protein n=1 Tax=Rhizobium leguminosarum TaxID=384 RepID=UPI0012FC4029|nr:hypothetical protein [Rhizobium leguminosarum]MBY2916068.1 hypothetical protein [Rhizobium leguminosarum]MBY2921726.1 hypothetical protein [Rhizobium leguminosarum]MBY2971303.1 hypothetical protein [Rhizobium leguminosarum]MBY2978705.1 hypothetical protein [Rhizobium leguminosarum]MBY3001760.1 hypothetical protein [Rhizobium leguminosarum]